MHVNDICTLIIMHSVLIIIDAELEVLLFCFVPEKLISDMFCARCFAVTGIK